MTQETMYRVVEIDYTLRHFRRIESLLGMEGNDILSNVLREIQGNPFEKNPDVDELKELIKKFVADKIELLNKEVELI